MCKLMDVSVSVSVATGVVEAIVILPPGTAEVEVQNDDILLVFLDGDPSQPLQVALPVPVDADTARVRFKKATGRLTFTASPREPLPATATSVAGGSKSPMPDAAASAGCVAGSPAVAATAAGVREASSAANTESAMAAPRAPAHSEAASAGAATSAPLAAVTAAAAGAGSVSSSGTSAAAAAAEAEAAEPLHSSTSSPSCPAATAAAATAAAATSVTHSSSTTPPPPTPPPPSLSSPMAKPACSTPPRSPISAAAATAAAADDAALYADFYCNSPPAMPASRVASASGPPPGLSPPPSPSRLPPAAATAAAIAAATSNGALPHPAAAANGSNGSSNGGGAAAKSVNAAKVAAAFEPTGGTASRDAGFSFTAPDLPPPPPLPPGLPPVAAPIDCRYLAIANGLRITAHAQTAAMAELLGLRQRPSDAAAARQRQRCSGLLDRVAVCLDAYGYAVLDNYISEAAIQAARKELQVMHDHYSPGLIWVGKEAEAGAQISVSGVRGDVVLWLDDQALGATAFVKDGVRRSCSFLQLQQVLADVDELVFEGLRPRLAYLAGLHRRSDAMMAIYPGKGSRFAKHVDNTTMDGRRLTVLTYLNPGWREEQGGALRLSPVREGAAPQVDVLPLAGRVALFLSAEVAHEVMPSFAPRHAVTLWYFDAGEHAASLAAARVMPGATSKPSAQAAATGLLRDLLADEAAAGIPETEEGCSTLGTRVAGLELGAKQLLAAVLGMPSAGALVESMQGLTPSSLRHRREELRNMGLNQQHHAPDTSSHVH